MEGVGNLLDIRIRHQLTKLASNHRAQIAGVDKHGLALLRLVAADKPKTYRNTRTVEQLRRQSHDSLYQVGFDDGLANLSLAATLTRKRTIRQHQTNLSVWSQMVNHVLHPRKVGVASWWQTILPAHIFLKRTLPPVAEVERRIGKNVICLQRRVLVIIECVGKDIAQVRIQATDGKVHVRHLPRIRVCLLTVDTNLAQVSLVALYKLGALYKHTAASAARVINSALVRLQNLYQRADNAGRRIELATILALQAGKLLQTVFVGSAQQVFLLASIVHFYVRKEIYHITQTTLVQLRTGKILRQNALQSFVFTLNGGKCFIYYHAYFRCVGSSTNLAPSGFSRHEEDVLGCVFVLIFRVGVFVALQLLELLFEAVADVFQKNESEHHTLVLRSAEVASQNIGSLPYFLFKTNADCILFLSHNMFIFLRALVSSPHSAERGSRCCP